VLQQKLQYYKQHHLLREIKEVDNNMINFSSNDYLGLSKSKKVKEAFIDGIKLYGFGSGSSPLISGYYLSTKKLEEAFALHLKKDEAIFFNSGYHANIGVIQALQKPIIMDKLCHASIIDGARLSAKQFYRYRHNDLEHAENLLQKTPNSLLISERVFSMEGDIADVIKLKTLAAGYKARLIIDDAHGFGVLENNIQSDLVIIPLGKALGGMGAIVAGDKELIGYLRQTARSYMYSTALPPAIAHANLVALKLLSQETWRLEKLKSLISLFNFYANKAGLNLASQDLTPIKSILIGDNKLAKTIEKKLHAKGFFVKAIVSPTVQISRIRISLCMNHSEENIINLIETIK
jgi:8-amino-7-oxononanoate synthase